LRRFGQGSRRIGQTDGAPLTNMGDLQPSHTAMSPISLRFGVRGTTAVLAAALLALPGCASWRLDKAAQTATGFTAHVLCDDIFVTGLDPQAAFAERVQPMPGIGLVSAGLQRKVDAAQQELTVSLLGAFESRARYREGRGCLVQPGGEAAGPETQAATLPQTPPSLPEIAGLAAVAPSTEAMAAALARALTDPRHRTKAVVVLRDGQVLAEAYAPGYGVDAPVLGFSMSKSVTNALVGILVRQGRLALEQPAPIAAWNAPDDPRRAITIEQLLRQTSGLDLPQDNSGFDVTSQIMYSVHDKAAAAAAAPLAATPGTRWAYTDANYLLLSRIVRDSVGGHADDVRAFAQHELVGPLGMRRVAIDFDATGTPIGAAHVLATPRDWARFGQLFLDDGVVGGQRLLPTGWVQMSTTPTLDTGYGAGFWTNRVAGKVPGWGVPWGLPQAPADAFFARGFMGQFIVVVPSERLVVVRLSVSHVRGDDIEETDRMVADIRAALRP
jgi:CubicO group peptidase (beta-lactamase class C family)